MQRTFTAITILALSCAACATVQAVPTDPRLVEAQKSFDEGQELQGAGQYALAIPLVERALALRKAVHTEAHPDVADCFQLLGVIYLARADYARAEAVITHALEIQK